MVKLIHGDTRVPESVESVVRPVDCEHGSACVGLGHPPVALQHDHLGPDLVVDALPLAEDLLDVVLQSKRERVRGEARDV